LWPPQVGTNRAAFPTLTADKLRTGSAGEGGRGERQYSRASRFVQAAIPTPGGFEGLGAALAKRQWETCLAGT
jgi:hypothetical protein